MKKLFFAALVLTSFSSFAAESNLACVVAKVKRLGNFSYDVEKELVSTTIALKDTAVIVIDNDTTEIFNGEEDMVKLVKKNDMKGKKIYTLGKNLDENDEATGELALFTGTITNNSITSFESDVKNSSINLFANEQVTSIDLELGIMIHCEKQ